jgi:hypothetical protein
MIHVVLIAVVYDDFFYECDVLCSPLSPFDICFSILQVRSCYNLAFGEQTVRQVNLMSSSLTIQNNFLLILGSQSRDGYMLFDLRMTECTKMISNVCLTPQSHTTSYITHITLVTSFGSENEPSSGH